MVKKHLKRLAAPKSWPIARKVSKYVTRPLPGGHSYRFGLALNTVIRELIRLSDTRGDANQIILSKNVLVDGVKRKESRFIVGLMDVVSFPDINLSYRMTINTKGQLHMDKISKEESNEKLCKIVGKTITKGGRLQLNLHDGRNILGAKGEYNTGDTLMLSIPGGEIKEHLKLEKGAFVLLTAGSHVGKLGHIAELSADKITVKAKEASFETRRMLAFVLGKDKPLISLGD